MKGKCTGRRWKPLSNGLGGCPSRWSTATRHWYNMLFFSAYYAFHYAVFLLKLCLKICFLPYIMLNYSKLCMHQKYIFLNTAGQNKRLFCRNPHLGIQTSSWYWCKSTLITRSPKEKRKGRWLQAHAKAPGWVLSRKIRHYCNDASRVTRTLTLVHGLKNVNHARPPETSWWKKTDP